MRLTHWKTKNRGHLKSGAIVAQTNAGLGCDAPKADFEHQTNIRIESGLRILER